MRKNRSAFLSGVPLSTVRSEIRNLGRVFLPAGADFEDFFFRISPLPFIFPSADTWISMSTSKKFGSPPSPQSLRRKWQRPFLRVAPFPLHRGALFFFKRGFFSNVHFFQCLAKAFFRGNLVFSLKEIVFLRFPRTLPPLEAAGRLFSFGQPYSFAQASLAPLIFPGNFQGISSVLRRRYLPSNGEDFLFQEW